MVETNSSSFSREVSKLTMSSEVDVFLFAATS